MSASKNSLSLVDLLKVIASQVIVLHHFVLYGPMWRTIDAAMPGYGDWLRHYGRLAVPAFIVIGGFLAARSCLTAADSGRLYAASAIVQRYMRLALPLAFAIAAALIAAGIARTLILDADTPARATLGQLLAHVLLMQDIAGIDSLSAGVWYVAIDFQLFATLILLLMLRRPWRIAAILLVTLASLFWVNRIQAADVWAPYFFGIYGLGILAWLASHRQDRSRYLQVIALITCLALLIEWRERIVIAGVVAILLAATGGRLRLGRVGPLVEWLSERAYGLFLMHYPVLLAIGAVVEFLWQDSAPASVAGLAVSWALSLGLAHLLHRGVEVRVGSWWAGLGRPRLSIHPR